MIGHLVSGGVIALAATGVYVTGPRRRADQLYVLGVFTALVGGGVALITDARLASLAAYLGLALAFAVLLTDLEQRTEARA